MKWCLFKIAHFPARMEQLFRAAGAASTTEHSRRAAKSARWEGLTFDTKDEIITWCRADRNCACNLDVVLALIRTYLSLHSVGSFLLRISEFLRGVNHGTCGSVQETH
jgi:hypothetical protein